MKNEHIEKARAMASAPKQYQGIHSVAVTGNYMPRWCGIATFTTDSVEGLVRLPDVDIYAAAMNDRPKGTLTPLKYASRSAKTS